VQITWLFDPLSIFIENVLKTGFVGWFKGFFLKNTEGLVLELLFDIMPTFYVNKLISQVHKKFLNL
jgi:hypothetical protein